MNSLTETVQLLKQHKEGDKDSLDQLYGKYYQRLGAITRLKMGNHLKSNTTEEDILQSAIIESFKSIEKFEYKTEGAFLHWMGKIISNKVQDKVGFFGAQKRNSNKLVGGSIEEYDTPSDDETPSMVIQKNEELELLEKVISKLPDDSKELLIMNKIEELSYEEIAEKVDSTPEAIRKKISRIMIKLSKDDLVV